MARQRKPTFCNLTERNGTHLVSSTALGLASQFTCDEFSQDCVQRIECTLEPPSLGVGEEGGGEHGDEDENREVDDGRSGRDGDEARLHGGGDGAEKLAARCVRAVNAAEGHEESRVEGAGSAENGADGERREVAEQAEREEHERRHEDDPHVWPLQRGGQAGERGDGGEGVADDDRVGEACCEGHDGHRRGGQDGRLGREDLGPRVAVGRAADGLADARNRGEGVGGDAAEEEEDGQRRDKRQL
eukprot:6195792-Pleurochrysis_carterae.AAC.3